VQFLRGAIDDIGAGKANERVDVVGTRRSDKAGSIPGLAKFLPGSASLWQA
jgi:hypothetical protein